MKTPAAGATRRQRGVAAVELALVLPVLLVMLAFPLYLGRALWHYTVIERAAQDAARYLSTIPLSEIKNSTLAPGAVAVASNIVAEEIAELAPGTVPPSVAITCDNGGNCVGFSTPATVRVNIQLQMEDVLFAGVTQLTVPLTAEVAYPYLGR